jgi:hypothetical protein
MSLFQLKRPFFDQNGKLWGNALNTSGLIIEVSDEATLARLPPDAIALGDVKNPNWPVDPAVAIKVAAARQASTDATNALEVANEAFLGAKDKAAAQSVVDKAKYAKDDADANLAALLA